MARHGSFAAFWPHYLREHARPATRALHYVGTSLVFAVAGLALATGRWWLLWAMPPAGYLFAWVAHFRVERNRPATFTHPLWSLVADFRMYFLWASGRLGPHLARAGVAGADGVADGDVAAAQARTHMGGHDDPDLDPRPVADPRRR